ncbi:endolytic transglycosylase MltG [Rathayibacter sp. KR2-224]|uniref:endolytic transglycosylase MltG n=1 Tax=Rathayibacter sp. KR2-224 TaxID=3400913 RepID=UPI003C108D81
MTQPFPPGSSRPDSSLDGERPPLTRREAREREARERAEGERTNGQQANGQPPNSEPTSEALDGGEAPSVEESFWGALNSDREPADDATADRGAGERAGGRRPPHAWSTLQEETPRREPRPRKRRRWLVATIVTVVILGLLGGAGAYVWNAFQPEVRKLLAINEPTDYTGSGTTPVDITIHEGDNGSDVASTLAKAGVVKTSDAFYTLLLQTKPDPVFQPGVYKLKKQMSAKSALTALQDPKNKLARTLTIPEGDTEADILQALAKTTGVPLADLQAAAAKPADYGVPAQAPSLEGFLFPATYTFDPGVDAKTVIKTLVDRAFQSLDQAGVPADKRYNTVVLASIVQKEAGSVDDMGKVARVFQNRLDQGMDLQSDATVAYGAGVKTVFTTDAQRGDASNPYNTYVHQGLPVGPISNPGDDAIKAALNPTPGGWLYFVTVDLKNGTTVFSQTAEEHDQAVQQLQDWCNASPENDAYCK